MPRVHKNGTCAISLSGTHLTANLSMPVGGMIGQAVTPGFDLRQTADWRGIASAERRGKNQCSGRNYQTGVPIAPDLYGLSATQDSRLSASCCVIRAVTSGSCRCRRKQRSYAPSHKRHVPSCLRPFVWNIAPRRRIGRRPRGRALGLRLRLGARHRALPQARLQSGVLVSFTAGN